MIDPSVGEISSTPSNNFGSPKLLIPGGIEPQTSRCEASESPPPPPFRGKSSLTHLPRSSSGGNVGQSERDRLVVAVSTGLEVH